MTFFTDDYQIPPFREMFKNIDFLTESVDFVVDLAKKRNWHMIYWLSKLACKEVSILVDSKDNYFVDWGTIGSVELSPPVGAVLPFKLWVHTHPSNTAYWSITDRNSLEIAKGILERALVLGEDGILSTTLQPTTSFTGANEGSNPQWTEEQVMDWLEYNLHNLDTDFSTDWYSPKYKYRWNGKRVFTDNFDSDGKDW